MSLTETSIIQSTTLEILANVPGGYQVLRATDVVPADGMNATDVAVVLPKFGLVGIERSVLEAARAVLAGLFDRMTPAAGPEDDRVIVARELEPAAKPEPHPIEQAARLGVSVYSSGQSARVEWGGAGGHDPHRADGATIEEAVRNLLRMPRAAHHYKKVTAHDPQ